MTVESSREDLREGLGPVGTTYNDHAPLPDILRVLKVCFFFPNLVHAALLLSHLIVLADLAPCRGLYPASNAALV